MKTIALFFLLTFSASLFTQEASDLEIKETFTTDLFHENEVKGILNIELFGKAPFMGSLSYEQNFNKNFGIGIGLGFGRVAKGEITRVVSSGGMNVVTEDGRYTDLIGSVPVYLLVKQGNGKHKVIEQLGMTTLLSVSLNKYPSGNDNSTEVIPLPFASLGYEYEGRKVIFRLPLYVGYLGNNSGIFPKFVPWGGIGLGIKLGD